MDKSSSICPPIDERLEKIDIIDMSDFKGGDEFNLNTSKDCDLYREINSTSRLKDSLYSNQLLSRKLTYQNLSGHSKLYESRPKLISKKAKQRYYRKKQTNTDESGSKTMDSSSKDIFLTRHLGNLDSNSSVKNNIQERQTKLYEAGLRSMKSQLDNQKKDSNLCDIAKFYEETLEKLKEPVKPVSPARTLPQFGLPKLMPLGAAQPSRRSPLVLPAMGSSPQTDKSQPSQGNNQPKPLLVKQPTLARARNIMTEETGRLLAAFKGEARNSAAKETKNQEESIDILIDEIKDSLKIFVSTLNGQKPGIEVLKEITQNNPACQHLAIYLEDPSSISTISSAIFLINPDLPKNLSLMITDIREYLIANKKESLQNMAFNFRIRDRIASLSRQKIKGRILKEDFHRPSNKQPSRHLEDVRAVSEVDFGALAKSLPSMSVSKKIDDLEEDNIKLNRLKEYHRVKGKMAMESMRGLKKSFTNQEINKPDSPEKIMSKGLHEIVTSKMESKNILLDPQTIGISSDPTVVCGAKLLQKEYEVDIDI